MSTSRSVLFADLGSVLKFFLSESRQVAKFGAKLREKLTAQVLKISFASYPRHSAPLLGSVPELAISEERALRYFALVSCI